MFRINLNLCPKMRNIVPLNRIYDVQNNIQFLSRGCEIRGEKQDVRIIVLLTL